MLSYSEFTEWFKNSLSKNNVFFINREGGTDFQFVKRMWDLKYKKKVSFLILSRFNGYYNKNNTQNNDIETFELLLKYCKSYVNAITASDTIFVRGPKIDMKIINSNFMTKNKPVNIPYVHYDFIEHIESDSNFLLDCWQFLENKKVLVISPFCDEIEAQYKKKDNLFKNFASLPGIAGEKYKSFKFPTFASLLFIKTYITYNDSDWNLNTNFHHCPHDNYHETVKYYQNKIDDLDFDIALVSCGGYTTELCYYIKTHKNKSSMYFGGSLQLYFGIRGRKYEYLNKLNVVNEYWILPNTKDLHTNLKQRIHKQELFEEMGAYFIK